MHHTCDEYLSPRPPCVAINESGHCCLMLAIHETVTDHTVEYAGFDRLDSEGNVTKFAPHNALKLIV